MRWNGMEWKIVEMLRLLRFYVFLPFPAVCLEFGLGMLLEVEVYLVTGNVE